MSYHAPYDLSEALAHVAAGARIVAGGTDLFPSLGEGPAPEHLVDLGQVTGLRGISATASGWRIGAATTWTDIVRADLPPLFDGLRAAAREVGSVQIQNAGTIGGNLCNASPAADGVPPLLALDARVGIEGMAGRREMALAGFLPGPRRTALRPGEVLAEILIPGHPAAARSAFVKLGSRRYMVISVAMVAVMLWPDTDRPDTGKSDTDRRIAGARVAVGACAPVARRLPALEARLIGRPWADLGSFDLHDPGLYAPLAPIDDARGSATYRAHAVPELCRRALARLAQAHG